MRCHHGGTPPDLSKEALLYKGRSCQLLTHEMWPLVFIARARGGGGHLKARLSSRARLVNTLNTGLLNVH